MFGTSCNEIVSGGGVFNVAPEPASANFPIFLSYYEESMFSCGHYQSIRPVGPSSVLGDLLAIGGHDVATSLGFSTGDIITILFLISY